MTIYKRDYVVFGGTMLVIALYVANASIQVATTEDSIELRQVRARLEKVQLENKILQSQVFDQQSYRTIEAKATELGFRRTTQNDFIQLKGGEQNE